jgi:thiaminase (transcriptional activator TenA)
MFQSSGALFYIFLRSTGVTGMSRFSERIWKSTMPLRHMIHSIPFNFELTAGTLSRKRFYFYMVQDPIYLAEYLRILALAAARSPDMEQLQAFAK